jgi:Chalcone isomerase-like
MLKFLSVLSVVLLLSVTAHADGGAVRLMKDYMSNPQKAGEGRLSYLIWDVYDATLYAPDGKYQNDKPVALALRYLRTIKGRDIADKSAEEIRNQGFKDEVALAIWHEQMRRIFTDVSPGTVFTGIRTNKNHTIIFKDGEKVGVFKDPEFTRRFFDIWLSARTSHPALRNQLLGIR